MSNGDFEKRKMTLIESITVRKQIQSQNKRESGGNVFAMRAKKAKEVVAWEWEIVAALGKKPKAATKKRKVVITSLRSRLLDIGNLYGGGKALVDAIVRIGLAVDDNPKFMELEMHQYTRPKSCGITQIEVWE